jgi:hypothetical protein
VIISRRRFTPIPQPALRRRGTRADEAAAVARARSVSMNEGHRRSE